MAGSARHGFLVSAKAPLPAGAYSHVVERGGLVLTAGFGPEDPATGAMPDGIAAQTDAALGNVAAALAEVGMGLDDVLRVSVHLADIERDFDGYDAAYRARFSSPYPVRTTVGSTLPGFLVEIDVVAVRSSGGKDNT